VNVGGNQAQITANELAISELQQKVQTSLDLSYGFKAFMLEAEAGDFATHAPLGWTKSQDAIALGMHNNVPVFEVPDIDAKLYNIEKPLTFQDIQDLHLYGGVFGGRIALNADTSIGGGGCFTSIETTQATSILNKDGSQAFSVTSYRRTNAAFSHNGTHVILSAFEGTSGLTLNGVDTVDVINWNGDSVINTVPEVLPGDFFDFELHIQNGLNQRMYLYINKILVGNPTFAYNTGGSNNHRVLYSSGSSGGANRHTYIRKFGSTINTTASEMVLTKADLEANTSMNLLVPNGTRNYSIVLDKGLNLDIGYTFNILSQTIGKISWRSPNGEGLAGTISGYASGYMILSGLEQIIRTNVLKNGAQFISSDVPLVQRDYSRLNSYLPIATPYTTPELVADTPTKLLIPTAAKTIKDFSLDMANLRWFLDSPGALNKWFIVHLTTSLNTSVQNQTITIEMYKNGVVEEGVGISRFMAGGADEGNLTLVGVTQLSHTDYIEVFVTLSASGTITFKRLAITINEMVGAI
jgi:hypothetical protein